MIENNDEIKTEGKQTRLPFDKTVVDKSTEIEDVCCLISDSDVRCCAHRLFELADTIVDRKLSKNDALRIIMMLTGKKHRSALEHILNRMKIYSICVGCESGYSLIIKKPCEVKAYLMKIGLDQKRE